MADLAIDGATRHDIGLFRLDRFGSWGRVGRRCGQLWWTDHFRFARRAAYDPDRS